LNDQSTNARTIAAWITAIVAAAFALYFGRELFVPIAFAVLLTVLFRPIIRLLERLRMSTTLAATLFVLLLIAATVVAGWFLSTPIQSWMDNAPARFSAAEENLNRLRRPVKQMGDVMERLQHAAQPTTLPSPTPPQAVPMQSRIFGAGGKLLAVIAEVLFLMYLLLASGSLFTEKLIKVIPTFRDKKVALDVVNEGEDVVALYMWVTLLINLGQGTLVGVVMWWLKMPSPLVWGFATVVLEFIPYLGAAIMVALLSIVAFATFDTFGHILAAPGAYLLITNIQNNIVSPFAYGHKLQLNPTAVLIGVLLWYFLWGIPGAFLAVPIVATIKVIADRVEGMKAVGEFLGE